MTKAIGIRLGKRAPKTLPGGRGDKLRPEDVDPKQLKIGTKHEREHTDSDALAQEIALDHLAEDPHYYSHLEDMEAKVSKAGPYIGPRGGKWADPKHTIPWKPSVLQRVAGWVRGSWDRRGESRDRGEMTRAQQRRVYAEHDTLWQRYLEVEQGSSDGSPFNRPEIACVVTPGGSVYGRAEGTGEVAFEVDTEDAVYIHTHPDLGDDEDGEAGDIPFSLPDLMGVLEGSERGLREMRAVTRNTVHVFRRPPGGWRITEAEIHSAWTAAANDPHVKAVEKGIRDRYRALVAAGKKPQWHRMSQAMHHAHQDALASILGTRHPHLRGALFTESR